MEPSRTRTARDLAAAEARARPATQYAAQYPTYPEQAQEFYPRRQRTAPAAPQPAPPPIEPVRPRSTGAAAAGVSLPDSRRSAPDRTREATNAPRRLLGLLTFVVLTGLSLPIHVIALFFVYVQVESPGDLASAVPLLAAMFVAVFAAMTVTGVLAQLVGGFPGRWRARVTFAALSGVIGLGIAYLAALTQF